MAFNRPHINLNPLSDTCPLRPMKTWWCPAMPSGSAMSLICQVICPSAEDGVGPPDGWLWITISHARSRRIPVSHPGVTSRESTRHRGCWPGRRSERFRLLNLFDGVSGRCSD